MPPSATSARLARFTRASAFAKAIYPEDDSPTCRMRVPNVLYGGVEMLGNPCATSSPML